MTNITYKYEVQEVVESDNRPYPERTLDSKKEILAQIRVTIFHLIKSIQYYLIETL